MITIVLTTQFKKKKTEKNKSVNEVLGFLILAPLCYHRKLKFLKTLLIK